MPTANIAAFAVSREEEDSKAGAVWGQTPLKEAVAGGQAVLPLVSFLLLTLRLGLGTGMPTVSWPPASVLEKVGDGAAGPRGELGGEGTPGKLPRGRRASVRGPGWPLSISP